MKKIKEERKISNSRGLTLLIYFILKKYSNEKTLLNSERIKEYLAKDFDISKSRKTIYSHLSVLKELSDHNEYNFKLHSNDIGEGDQTKSTGYYIETEQPDIEEGEIKLLCDAIATSRFISKKYSEDLINKLGKIVNKNKYSSHYEEILRFKGSSNKSYNLSLFLNIEDLSVAIKESKKITFQYLKFDVNKKLVPKENKNNGYVTVSPYNLIWAINHYYLFCSFEDSDEKRFLRVDKINAIRILDKQRDPLPQHFDINEYSRTQGFMFGGERETISFRCEMRMVGQVIDFFGEDVYITPIDEKYFRVKVRTSIESIQYWVLQYITAIDQIEPKKLNDIIVGFLEDALRRNRK
jgi:predicted DNA-binding transcriptional regulator YafY